MAIINFNATTVDPSGSFDPLPPGWYHARMVESELKPTKAGDGSYLSAQFEIIEGQYANRRIFTNFNLENKNPIAVRIAQEQLSALGYCVGVVHIQDSTMLHGIPLQIKLKVREASGGYEASNDVVGYRDQHGREAKEIIAAASAGGGFGGSAPAAPAAPGAPAAPPSAPSHDPLAVATADGWAAHPSSPGWFFKGQEVIDQATLIGRYPAPAVPAAPPAPPAPNAAPAAPAAPNAAPAAPQAPSAPVEGAPPAAPTAGASSKPPWA